MEVGGRFLGGFGVILLSINIIVVGLSLSDMFLLATGAVRVELPAQSDFSWSFDTNNTSIVFTGHFSIHNRGFYDITDLHIDATVTTTSGAMLVTYHKTETRIAALSGGRYSIVAVMPVERLLQLEYGILLSNTIHIRVNVKTEAHYELGLVWFQADQTMDYRWKPKLQDLYNFLEGGNINKILQHNLTLLQTTPAIFQPFVASAILANGTTIILRTNDTDATFQVVGQELRIGLYTHDSPPVKLDELIIPLRIGGQG